MNLFFLHHRLHQAQVLHQVPRQKAAQMSGMTDIVRDLVGNVEETDLRATVQKLVAVELKRHDDISSHSEDK